MTIYDISPPIRPGMAVFPGDTPPTREVLLDRARGDPITLSTLRSTVHVGAHADAPSHYGPGAASIEAIPLHHYLGSCVVVAARARRGRRVGETDLAGTLTGLTEPRVLIRTGTVPDPAVWNDDFAALDPALIDALAARGVHTVGVDTPSVDPADSKTLPAHARCLAHGIAILEGLRLDHVAPGRYELIALPLPLVGFDASPVRAVLRTIG